MIFDKSFLQEIGIYEYGVIDTRQIVFSDEVRSLCEGNVCGNYGRTWACPPAVGLLEDCRARCLEYSLALVFNAKYNLDDSFDFEGMVLGHKEFKKVCDRLDIFVKDKITDYLLLSNEGCILCSDCAYPDEPCRFPEKLFPSVEAFGVRVDALAKTANMNYINGKNTVTYFGLLLY